MTALSFCARALSVGMTALSPALSFGEVTLNLDETTAKLPTANRICVKVR